MRTIFDARGIAALAALALATVAAAPSTHTFVYRDTLTTPSGTQQNVTASITVAPQADGSTAVTLVANDKPPVTITVPANGTPPAPTGSPSPQRAQGALILQRLAILAQIRKAVQAKSPIAVQIPVLPPGALQTLTLPATLTRNAGSNGVSLTGNATTSTTATIDPQKAKIKGILPMRRLAERAKNALTPSHVTLPDQVTATVKATMANRSVKLSGTVEHALTAKGQTTTLTEDWSIQPST